MKAIVLASTAAAALALRAADPVIHDDLVAAVNSKAKTWRAEMNDRFRGMTVAQARKMMGTIKYGPVYERKMASLPVKKYNSIASALPTSWDARTAWPACSTTISHVRDQSACGSCWAFGSTEAFNDRACITHNVTKEYSASDTNSCCNGDNGCSSMGCDGGYPSDAWNYFVNTGLVTGGDYDTVNTGATCFPYPLPTCSHHEQGKYPMCPTNEYNTPACPTACTDAKYPTKWASDLSFAKSAYSVNSVTDIMTELVNNGPVTAAFDVYEDFLTYKSGVYKYTTGQLLGGHAVEILGYGTDPTAGDYWVVKNSWNQYWGANGYFLIAKGVDECGIEDGIVAGLV